MSHKGGWGLFATSPVTVTVVLVAASARYICNNSYFVGEPDGEDCKHAVGRYAQIDSSRDLVHTYSHIQETYSQYRVTYNTDRNDRPAFCYIGISFNRMLYSIYCLSPGLFFFFPTRLDL